MSGLATRSADGDRLPAHSGDAVGHGKVQLSMQNRIVEYQAFTDEAETLQSGESVEVVDVAGGDTVYVPASGKKLLALSC